MKVRKFRSYSAALAFRANLITKGKPATLQICGILTARPLIEVRYYARG